uniref:Uncharacterized protein n=1 Tax=Ditylenchus dipsaci TaxID=166011 RepID=A0A915EM89_9BILA
MLSFRIIIINEKRVLLGVGFEPTRGEPHRIAQIVFHALPLDADTNEEPTAGNNESTNPSDTSANGKNRKSSSAAPSNHPSPPQPLPKMVLVEIDGVRMFYPTCFVGMLAEEMVLETSTIKSAKSSNAPAGMPNFCAEDHEVEEILNSSNLSFLLDSTILLPKEFRCKPSKHRMSDLRAGIVRLWKKQSEIARDMNVPKQTVSDAIKKFRETGRNEDRARSGRPATATTPENIRKIKKKICHCNVPPQLRHWKRTFTGVRAAQCSFQDGCLSVISGNNPSTSSLALASNDTQQPQQQMENSQMDASHGDNTKENIHKDYYAFHRSPIALESVTPDHSPTFVDELNSLKELQALKHPAGEKERRTKTMTKPMMASRCLCGLKILDLDTDLAIWWGLQKECTDIFKILQQSCVVGGKGAQAAAVAAAAASNGCGPPRVITPFTPITSITPEPDDQLSFAKEQ